MCRSRSRLRILATLVVAVLLGLGSRKYPDHLHGLVQKYAGDVLWAFAAYLGLVLVRPSLSRRTATALALVFSLLVETSQLYHAPWIDAVRATRLGGLILGFGFLWSDLVCYAVGIALATWIDQGLLKRSPNASQVAERIDQSRSP